jgi:hypothetical protein
MLHGILHILQQPFAVCYAVSMACVVTTRCGFVWHLQADSSTGFFIGCSAMAKVIASQILVPRLAVSGVHQHDILTSPRTAS